MSITSNVISLIFTTTIFNYVSADCVPGTSFGCPNHTICFLNQCYPSSGPCIDGRCPNGFVCVDGLCLNVHQPATTSTTTTTTTTTTRPQTVCVDRSVPGHPSDCSARKYLCNNPIYYNLMTEQCPRTCNRCPDSNFSPYQPQPTCFDRPGPDGTSNCASVAYLCRNFVYQQLMREQCPRTCNYC